MKNCFKINNFVKFKIIKLLDSNSEFLGIFKLSDCLNISKNSCVDLVEVSFENNTSTCKLIKYDKFLYSEFKKNKIKKKLNKKNKEIKINLFISDNDYKNKLKSINKFLISGLKVKITLIIKGREAVKIKIINEKLNKIINDVSLYGFLTNKPNIKLKNIFLFFDPKKLKI